MVTIASWEGATSKLSAFWTWDLFFFRDFFHLNLTASSHLKMDGWNRIVSFWDTGNLLYPWTCFLYGDFFTDKVPWDENHHLWPPGANKNAIFREGRTNKSLLQVTRKVWPSSSNKLTQQNLAHLPDFLPGTPKQPVFLWLFQVDDEPNHYIKLGTS